MIKIGEYSYMHEEMVIGKAALVKHELRSRSWLLRNLLAWISPKSSQDDLHVKVDEKLHDCFMSVIFSVRSACNFLRRSISSGQYRRLHTRVAMSEISAPKSIDSVPAPDQLIEHDGTIYNTIKEGLAHILVPPTAKTITDPKATKQSDGSTEQAQSVFYNPIQQFNRDLSVLAIKAYGEDICARRRQKTLHTRAKKEKKRSMKEQGEDGEVKRRKVDEAPATSGESSVNENVQDVLAREGAIPGQVEKADAPIHSGKPSTDSDTEMRDPSEQDKSESLPQAIPSDVVATNGEPKDQANSVADAATLETQSGQPNKQHTEHTPKFRILDALSASGLRALRYAHEIPFTTSVVANDMSPPAVAAIALNVRHNKLAAKISPSTGNAIAHMYKTAFATVGESKEPWAQGKYDVVDLDPYGTAAPFLDAAIQAINDNGLLCVTCTDAGVFASCGYIEKTYSLYGGLPIKGVHSHEAGLRLILNSIATSAARYGMAIEPLLSLSIDFYARVFVRVRKSPADVKFLAGKTMLVHQCDSGCGAWQTQYLARHTAQDGRANFKHTAGQSSSDRSCPHCGFKTHVAGPMWGGALHNPYFIKRILDSLPTVDKTTYQTTQRIEGMLTCALEELDVLPPSALEPQGSTEAPFIPSMPQHAIDPHPFFFIPSVVAKVLHCRAPGEAPVKGALRKAGFVATRSHAKPGTIKTQASWDMIWEMMREWVRQKAPIKEGKVGGKMPGYKILEAMRKGDDAAENAGDVSAEGGTDAAKAASGEVDPKKIKIVFDERLGKDRPGKKLTRYQENPRENWGPMSRARGA